MSDIQGMDLEAPEQQAPVRDGDPNVAPQGGQEQDDENEGLIETVRVGEQRMVPVSELVAQRRANRENKQKIAELSQQVQRAAAIEQQLEQLRPTLDIIRANPRILEAVKAGTHATPGHVDQPDDDQEAKDLAEDNGYYTTTGELDVARARRVLDRIEARVAKRMEAQIAPLRAQTHSQAAQAMRQKVSTLRTKDGAPMASTESINEIFGMVPEELQGDPRTAFVMTLAAAGMDLYSGRKPQAPVRQPEYGEPIYTEPAGGRRGPAPVSAELAALGKRVGLNEKQISEAAQKFTGRSIELE